MKVKKPARTARQLIRWRNIMLGLPITHIHIASIPYGYEIDPDKKGWLRPVDKQLQALYWARHLRCRSTLAELARWVSKEGGRPIGYHSLDMLFRYRPPLNTYLLPLHDRISIATCPTEEEAIRLQPEGAGWERRKNLSKRTAYLKARAAAVRLRDEANGVKREEDTLSAESGTPNGVPSSK